jgi:hypothetical protein
MRALVPGAESGEGAESQQQRRHVREARKMTIDPAEAFGQLTWTILLAIPVIVALLHLPLLVEWAWRHAIGRAAGLARRIPV